MVRSVWIPEIFGGRASRTRIVGVRASEEECQGFQLEWLVSFTKMGTTRLGLCHLGPV